MGEPWKEGKTCFEGNKNISNLKLLFNANTFMEGERRYLVVSASSLGAGGSNLSGDNNFFFSSFSES